MKIIAESVFDKLFSVLHLLEFFVVTDDKAIYTSEKAGSDETGDGSEEKPFKTALQALRVAVQEPWPTIYVDAKEEGAVSNIGYR